MSAPCDSHDDSSARTMVFIDGQNLYKSCQHYFGHPLCHPRLLADHLAGHRRQHRPRVRFYTGRPNPNMNEEERIKARNLDRRLAAMQATGVTVVTRQLRYHWQWAPVRSARLPRPHAQSGARTVEMQPWRRPQEKGIDTVLALDVVEFVLGGECDVAIVVSRDRDLHEIPEAIRKLKRLLPSPVRVEAAVPVPAGQVQPVVLTGFHYTHQITPDIFQLVRDDTDYTVPHDSWKPPRHPRSLEEHLSDGSVET